MTTVDLLQDLVAACARSALVASFGIRDMDEDILSVRVLLGPCALGNAPFVSVFYNVATDKAAFALVVADKRVFGRDDAKGAWHEHPFARPDDHVLRERTTFGEFLATVEAKNEEMTR
jgi:hypothetical protein